MDRRPHFFVDYESIPCSLRNVHVSDLFQYENEEQTLIYVFFWFNSTFYNGIKYVLNNYNTLYAEPIWHDRMQLICRPPELGTTSCSWCNQ